MTETIDNTPSSPPPDNVVVGPWGAPVGPPVQPEIREEVLRAREALDVLKFTMHRSLKDLSALVARESHGKLAAGFLRRWLEEQSVRGYLEVFWGNEPTYCSVWQTLDAQHLRLLDLQYDYEDHLPADCWIRHETSILRNAPRLHHDLEFGLRQRQGQTTSLRLLYNTIVQRFNVVTRAHGATLPLGRIAPRGPPILGIPERNEIRMLVLYSLARIIELEAQQHARANGHREPKASDRVLYWLHVAFVEAGRITGGFRPLSLTALQQLESRWEIDHVPRTHDLAVFKSFARIEPDPNLDPAMHGIVKGIA